MRSRSLESGFGSTAGGGVECDSKSATTLEELVLVKLLVPSVDAQRPMQYWT